MNRDIINVNFDSVYKFLYNGAEIIFRAIFAYKRYIALFDELADILFRHGRNISFRRDFFYFRFDDMELTLYAAQALNIVLIRRAIYSRLLFHVLHLLPTYIIKLLF